MQIFSRPDTGHGFVQHEPHFCENVTSKRVNRHYQRGEGNMLTLFTGCAVIC